MESPRPLAAMVAVVLLEVIAIGTFGFGLLLLAAGAQLQLGTAGVVLGATAVASLVVGALAVVAGIGVWRGRAWGWVTALAVAVVGLLGVAAAALSSAFQSPLLIAIALFGGVLACLFVPSVRSRAGIG